ncbi:MAG: pilus assembly protein N-terminal domain-containing protein [Candidatus Binataceae bacterium]|jgi:pilus assembly protein CpaC
MKLSLGFARMKTVAVAVAVVAMSVATPAARGAINDQREVKLGTGDSYIINGIDTSSTPEVRFGDNPNAFKVGGPSPSELLVSALHPGTGTVRVKVAGKSETYAITVAALDPSVVSATKANDSVNSGERTAQAAPSTASALDPGAGPAKAAGTGTAAASTPANMNPMLPSQPASAEKYTKNPPASEAVDSLERESAVNGRHYLSPDAISMMTGTSRVYDFVAPLRRVSIADSKIADIQVINPHQLMLVGHNPGFTTLVVWDTQGHYQERQVRIEKEGHQQVVLNVIVAEIDRNKLEQQGIDYSIVFPKALVSFASLAGNVATPFNAQTSLNTTGPGGVSNGAIPPPGGNPFPLTLSTNITYALTAQNSNVWANSFFQFVEDHQLGRILAEPRLLANSGEEAKFLSGGEIPIVMATALSSSITFKQYGTSVEFLPTVVGRHDIELVVKPEVSSPDYSQGVSEYGFTIPAFVTRRAETAVRMKENQTLLIAGLIGDTVTSHINKVPYLGDIPWAGALFKNTYYEQDKTELVISVTPQIVQPIPVNGQVVLPTERPPMSPEDVRTKPLDVPDVTRERLQ